jgi:hypothetical protein
MKYKFHVGQVVYDKTERVYTQVTAHYQDEGGNWYTIAWSGDPNYDEISEDDLRALTARERRV